MTQQPTAALIDRAWRLHQGGRLPEAEAICQQVLVRDPQHVDALHLLGIARLQRGDPRAALGLIDRALLRDGGNIQALLQRGIVLRALGEQQRALQDFQNVLNIRSDSLDALNNIGSLLREMQRPLDALQYFDRALQLRPDHARSCNNRGNALRDLKRLEEALECFDQAILLQPDLAEAHSNRCTVLLDMGRPGDALGSARRALDLKPGLPGALNNMSNACLALGQLEEALACAERACSAAPHALRFQLSRAQALLTLHRAQDAIRCCDAILQREPDNFEALNNRCVGQLQLRDFHGALASAARLLSLAPDYPAALHNASTACMELDLPDEAIRHLRRLNQVAPDYDYAPGLLFHTMRQICAGWPDHAATIESLEHAVLQGRHVDTPAHFLAVSDSPAAQLQCARAYVQRTIKPGRRLAPPRPASQHARLRVAYLSGDFGDHPVAQLSVGLFERHDRSRFEVFGISLQPRLQTPLRRRLQQAFEHFEEAGALGDTDIAALLRDREIDIAVDMGGHTQGSRPRVFALRPAPVQVNFLGYAGTTGAEYMDYILADSVVIPAGEEQHYAEQVVRLPCFLPADDRRAVDPVTPPRAAEGLPEDGFVFCAFNASYKITPEVFTTWMQLLREVPASVLWLRHISDAADANLRSAALTAGIAAGRLVFAARADSPDRHLARQRLADLFLDTLPYNAHSTASDALWVGLPVLTRRGRSFAARVAASLLLSLGLPELVTESPQDYHRMALRLATDRQLLRDLRARLESQRRDSPVFNTGGYCRRLEAAYREMWRRCGTGEGPGAFSLSA
ncbi:MAG TPA: tetratricopeptide repeat protein [Steroidobacteraceae bacterium]|nr:tetratricopeptide repeat protein [Steroidobacteraceae bacterium]